MARNIYKVPEAQKDWIRRSNSINKLKKINKTKNNFAIIAPGGYGKTILAIQFLSETKGKKAWITINKKNNDISSFLKVFLNALSKILQNQKFKELLLSYKGNYSLGEVLEILQLLPNTTANYFIIVDDLHKADEEILNTLSLILKSLNNSSIIIGLIGRVTIPNLDDNVLTLSSNDLTFSNDEINELCINENKHFDYEGINKIAKLTKGQALTIKALLIGDEDLINNAILTYKDLDNYIDEIIHQSWNLEILNFVLHLIFIDEITPELAVRLTGNVNAKKILYKLHKENIFLLKIDNNTYTIHDLFIDYLVKKSTAILNNEILYKIKKISAEIYFEQEDYLSAAKLYLENRDFHSAINSLIEGSKYENHIPIEKYMKFIEKEILPLSEDDIINNYYLLFEKTWYGFLCGNSKLFNEGIQAIINIIPKIIEETPEHIQTIIFLVSLYYNMSLKDFALKVVNLINNFDFQLGNNEISVVSITHNLPYFHRSMRDYSEFYDLNNEDINIIMSSFGILVESDAHILESCLKAGIYYERNNILIAAKYALDAYGNITENTNYETVFCASMILISTLKPLGAEKQISKIYNFLENYIKKWPANNLYSNLKAMVIFREINQGNLENIKNWLDINYIPKTKNLSFCKLGLYYTIVYSYIALEEYDKAIEFGKKLNLFAKNYNRPLDQIESNILLSISYYEKHLIEESYIHLKRALNISYPYNFTRQFIKYGIHTYPILLGLINQNKIKKGQVEYVETIINNISNEYDSTILGKVDKLSPRRQMILELLNEDLTYAEIAKKTGLTFGTIKNHIGLLYKTLNVQNAQDAIEKGKMLGFLK
ncbi:LuxR C-terminal-related transcriptional regulator [Miniphocaeibacter halophilus]|uniref:Uncharacterized protein n=1 Tax=Miniphocaeibacter halophilus TaxID=2931922 RepID=A0AC61MTP6_9FIRM|nr:LuxR C-terminal-related transcriptional regulator [Miniphocaeibacter halophilus]QQK08204.1 hypothetical protein JFY71_01315 [Miniphocaeibacter halophilus]